MTGAFLLSNSFTASANTYYNSINGSKRCIPVSCQIAAQDHNISEIYDSVIADIRSLSVYVRIPSADCTFPHHDNILKINSSVPIGIPFQDRRRS